MAVAKRVLFVALGLILLIAAVGWAYWTYRQFRANQAPIPRNATSVLRIHVDGLIRDIAWNALWNGVAYRDTTKQRSTTFSIKQWKQLGIQIPANLFLYQLDHARSNEFRNIYFGSVGVVDPAAFAAWLQDELGMEIGNGEHGTVASSERALVVIQPQRALFALSSTKPKTSLTHLTDVLANVLEQYGGNVAVNKSDFHEIIHDKGQVSGCGTHRFAIDFKKGMVAFNGWYEMDYAPNRRKGKPHFADSNAVSMWVQSGLTGLLAGKEFDIGGHTVQGDSLLVHYGGSIALEWKGTVTQQDTIVNFNYDDNFELVETAEIVDKSVPAIYCSLLADTALIDYLQAQGVLDTPGNIVNRDVFPLFRLGVTVLPSGFVQFHTAGDALSLPQQTDHEGHDLLYVKIDFNKLQVPGLPAYLAPYMEMADFFELSGHPASANQLAVQGTLRMEDARVHSLVQLLALH